MGIGRYWTMDRCPGQDRRVERIELDITPEQAAEASERKNALRRALTSGRTFTYADSTIVAKLGRKRMAYLLPERITKC